MHGSDKLKVQIQSRSGHSGLGDKVLQALELIRAFLSPLNKDLLLRPFDISGYQGSEVASS